MRKRMLGKLGMAAAMLAMTATFTGIAGGGTYVPDVVYAASAVETLEVDGVGSFTYTKDDKLVTITGFTSTAAVTELDLEQIFKDKGVLTDGAEIGVLGKDAFKDKTSLTTIILPGSLTTIGEGAFNGCTGLTNVTFKDGTSSLETIGTNAFIDCKALTEIELYSGLKTIGFGAFRGCSALTEIELPDTLEVIRSWAFRQSGLTRITIPASCTTIEGGGPYSSYGLFNVEPYCIGAFFNCKSLQEVVFEERDTSIAIGQHAFEDCNGLKSIEFPDKVNEDAQGKSNIPEYLFSGCSALSNVKLPTTCGQINEGAFDGCKSLGQSLNNF